MPKRDLLKFKILNFKSIQELKFTIKNDVNILIGQNESGKSNILQAIQQIKGRSLNFEDINFNTLKPVQIAWSSRIDNTRIEKIKSLFLTEFPEFEEKLKPLNDSFLTKCIDQEQKYHFNFLYSENEKKNFWKNFFEFLKFFSLSIEEKKKEYNSLNSGKFLENLNKWHSELLVPEKFMNLHLIFNGIEDWISNLLNHNNTFPPLTSEIINKIDNISKKILNLLADFSRQEDFFEIIYFNHEDFKSKYTFTEALRNDFFLGFWKKLGQDVKDIKKLHELSNKQDNDSISRFEELKEELKQKTNDALNKMINNFSTQKTINFKIFIKDTYFWIQGADCFNDEENEENKIGIYKGLEKRSKGFSSFLSLYFFVNYYALYNLNKIIIILIDEPGAHLHAQAVLDLKRLFQELIEKNKNLGIVMTTHNPFWIDEENINEIKFIRKTTKKGTKCFSKLMSNSNKENISTLSPFLYQMGIDRKSFMQLSESIHVFVEGYSDMLLFDGMKNYFGEKYKNLFFIPTNGAAKKTTLFNVLFAINKKIPYFIFDYDDEGSKQLKKRQKESFYNQNKKNVFFNNLEDEYKKNNQSKQTQELFTIEEWRDKKISEIKKENFWIDSCFDLWKDLKKQKIKLSKKTIENFKKVFERIDLQDD